MNERPRCEICADCKEEWPNDKELADLKAELLLTKHALANATAALHGTRQHVTEVNQDG